MIRRKRRRAHPMNVPKRLGKRLEKKGPWRSKAFRERVVLEPCLLAGRLWACGGVTDPHHCKHIVPSGTAKPPDWTCVPLCRNHHTGYQPASVHGWGDEAAFWRVVNIDPRIFIRTFSPEGAAALAELEGPDIRDPKAPIIIQPEVSHD